MSSETVENVAMTMSSIPYSTRMSKTRARGSTIPVNRNLGHQIFQMNLQKYHGCTGDTGVPKKSEERATERESMKSDVSSPAEPSSGEVGVGPQNQEPKEVNKVNRVSPVQEIVTMSFKAGGLSMPMKGRKICLEVGNKDGEGKVVKEGQEVTETQSWKRAKKIDLDKDNLGSTAEKNENLEDLKPAVDENEKSVELKSGNQAPFLSMQRRSFLTKILGWNDNPGVLTVAVDATPTRGGGLLRLPGREKTIFYYSLDWSDHFDFHGDSTKFEMINAALALELFEPFVKGYRGQYKWFVVKTDSPFFKSVRGFKDKFDAQFLGAVLEKVAAYKGTFIHTIKSSKDKDIINADYLSRTMLPVGLKEFYGNDDGTEIDYTLIDFSKGPASHVLDDMNEFIPAKYLKMFG